MSRICPGRDWALDDEADVPAWLLALELPGDVVDLSAEVDGLEIHGGSRSAGENQQILDEHGHLLGGVGDFPGVVPAVLAETVRALFQQQPAVTS